jgi:hypothetical protein
MERKPRYGASNRRDPLLVRESRQSGWRQNALDVLDFERFLLFPNHLLPRLLKKNIVD